ncbi:tetratricopeptide repeat protein [Hyalangium minutum]|uniref:TPR domain protein, putative component of TonB system n=1 Tax=Hyalangium minutum TaxID=394096 RepID=A0A085WQH4_9BACT|nr:tetratricopeptide repeat protein [Hyalangium minutum]KFE69937.1 TPR domain protein, putative component of TonB system [Hyalangium minutum]
MKAFLRFGALAVGVALTASGVGEAAPPKKAVGKKPAAAAKAAPVGKKTVEKASKEKAPSAVPGAPEEKRRNGPARVAPANAKFAELPRIADSKKDALADKKRDEAIEGFKRLIPKIQDGTSRKADLLYRLSELYWEKSKYLYRLEMDRYLEAEKKYDAAVARGEKLEAPKEDHRDSERYRAEVMSLYEDILRDYPQYEIRDEVLFSQAYNLYELGRQPEAVKRYEELIRDFPKSQFVPDAYIQLGNHYFDNNKLMPAKQNYEKARDTGVPKIYAYAIYKLAWCDFNAGDYEAGLKKLQEAVEYAETRGEELGDLKTEALNDLTVFYVQLDLPKDAIAYFKAKAPEKRQARLIAKTAVGLADAGHFDSGIYMFRWLIDDKPMGPSAPEFQQAIVRSYEGLRQRTQVRAEMKKMVDLYRPGGTWWEANTGNKSVLRNAFNVTEEAMRVMVTEYHQEAQKTREVATYQLARDIYKEYVDAFASSSDPDFVSDSAFNLRFFYAEILWALEEWEAAAAQYDAVVAFKIPDRDSAREVSNETYRKSASFAAVLAYDKLVKIERGQLAKSDLKAGQKVDENKYKGDVEKKRIIKKNAKEQPEQQLTRFEERLVAACDTYNSLYPNNQDEVDLRYQAAVILYDRNHFVDAARRFGEIIVKFPEERRSRDAADLTMFVLESREEWFELNKLARQFLGNKKLTKPGTEFAARVAKVVEGSQYKWVDEVVYRQEKNPKKAAELFLEFVTEFPKSENADRALTYAMIIFQEAAELDRGVEAGERVLQEYPDSVFDLKVRYTLAGFYEKMAEFKKAAEAYEAFVAAYDEAAGTAKKKKTAKGGASKVAQGSAEREQILKDAEGWVADALFNAGVWWEGVGNSPKAIAAYQSYISRFRDRKDVPQIAFNIALVHEKDGKWAEAAKAFASFSETYSRDARTNPGQLYLAKYRELMAQRQLKSWKDMERLQSELVRGWAKLPDESKQNVSLVDAYAHARFMGLEALWKHYSDIKFTRVSTIRRDLAAKQREIQRVEKEYAAVLAIGSGEWGIAALTRIGLAYADFARNIIESPDPKGLDEEQTTMYRGELENLALPLEDKSTEALEKALDKAYELSIYNEFTLAAQDQVNRYRPGAYAQVRQVPFRGSEFFATSDVAKDPGMSAAATAGSTPTAPSKPTQAPSAPQAQPQAPQASPAPAATVGEARP